MYESLNFTGKVFGGSQDGKVMVNPEPHMVIHTYLPDNRLSHEYYRYNKYVNNIYTSGIKVKVEYGAWIYSILNANELIFDTRQLSISKVVEVLPDFMTEFDQWFDRQVAINLPESKQSELRDMCISNIQYQLEKGKIHE